MIYPLLRRFNRKREKGIVLVNSAMDAPRQSLYELSVSMPDGAVISLQDLAGRKILLVNTASNCGYTAQFAELQSLHSRMQQKLAIIAFPANDFKEQEMGDDKQIAEFCSINYGVTFPVARKGVVVKSPKQQPVYRWLTSPDANGWCDHAPDWNFSKYLINEEGVLTHYFGPAVSPLESVVLKAIDATV